MSATLELALQLMRCRSVTPADDGCQEILISRLQKMGFNIHRLPFGKVTNFWAEAGIGRPMLVFAGHTDVVPPGRESEWRNPPFEPLVHDGLLYGRGAADMKGSLAAMITACESYLGHNKPVGSIGFLITSDEEGDAIDGTNRVLDWLLTRQIAIDYCIVGEPSSRIALGDTLRIGRRGSLSGRLTVNGIQGHVAYAQLARNPIHEALPALAELVSTIWDQGNQDFPPTSFQISNLHAGTGAGNVIPSTASVDFNFRFSTESDQLALRNQTAAILDAHRLNYKLEWILGGNPFLTSRGQLIEVVSESIRRITGLDPELSTAGGTSDGRFIAPRTGAQLVELGPCNDSIHKVNEHVSVDDLDRLSAIYTDLLTRLLGPAKDQAER